MINKHFFQGRDSILISSDSVLESSTSIFYRAESCKLQNCKNARIIKNKNMKKLFSRGQICYDVIDITLKSFLQVVDITLKRFLLCEISERFSVFFLRILEFRV